MKKFLSGLVSTFIVLATVLTGPVSAAETYSAQLYARVTDAGQVVNKMVIDFGSDKTVSGVDTETFTVHAKASTEAIREGSDVTSYGDYDLDRTIVKVETNGGKVTVYFDETQGATLAYLSSARNYPADLTYTITQNKAIKASAKDGRELADINAIYSCDNSVIDNETTKFESVKDKINYQFHKGSNDSLIVWFHGNGEGDYLNSGNNVAQMLANRGTVAWATDEAKEAFGDAYVMSFQAPDTWYYAQKDELLKTAYDEIQAVVAKYGINPNKIAVSGCSAGGYMTTRMLIAYPELFAAAMINCPALDVADARGGETPTDAELKTLRDSKTAIWLVQGETDGTVATDACSKRLFNILTEGQEVTSKKFEQALDSDFTTYETKDGKYKMSLYATTDAGKLQFGEDYDQDGEYSLVEYSNHWSWIYTLRNNPQAANGTHIWQWAASYMVENEVSKDPVKTGDASLVALYATFTLATAGVYTTLKRREMN